MPFFHICPVNCNGPSFPTFQCLIFCFFFSFSLQFSLKIPFSFYFSCACLFQGLGATVTSPTIRQFLIIFILDTKCPCLSAVLAYLSFFFFLITFSSDCVCNGTSLFITQSIVLTGKPLEKKKALSHSLVYLRT